MIPCVHCLHQPLQDTDLHPTTSKQNIYLSELHLLVISCTCHVLNLSCLVLVMSCQVLVMSCTCHILNLSCHVRYLSCHVLSYIIFVISCTCLNYIYLASPTVLILMQATDEQYWTGLISSTTLTEAVSDIG